MQTVNETTIFLSERQFYSYQPGGNVNDLLTKISDMTEIKACNNR